MKIVLEKNGFFKKGNDLLHDSNDLLTLEKWMDFTFSKEGYEFESVEKADYQDNTLYLSYHKMSPLPNVWTLKRAYLPGYYYLDRCGYSGWAEICKSELHLPYSDKVADEFYEEIKEYLKTRASKYKQKEEEFKCDSPYVFVPLQMENDEVAKLSSITSVELATKIVKWYRGTDYKIVVKPHPFEEREIKGAIMTNTSIHDIIPKASSVMTVNSGVGFESLLYLKKVITFGRSDYEMASPVALFNQDKKRIKKYLYHMLKFYFLNINDKENTEHHLKRIKNEGFCDSKRAS